MAPAVTLYFYGRKYSTYRLRPSAQDKGFSNNTAVGILSLLAQRQHTQAILYILCKKVLHTLSGLIVSLTL